MWHRILVPVESCNKVIQVSHATSEMGLANTEILLAQLLALRDSWKAIWNEAKLIASSLQMEIKTFQHRNTAARERTRFQDEDTSDGNVNEMNEADEFPEEAHFRKHIIS